jgi:hypothetical protein
MKKVYLALLLCLASIAGFAQSNGLNFDGSNDNVVVPNSASLTMGTELTIEAWVNIPGPQLGNIILKGNYGWGVIIGNDGCTAGNKLNYWVFPACPLSITSTGTIPYNAWTHIAVVVTTSPTKTLNFYINGIPAGSSTDPSIAIDNGGGGSLILGSQGTGCFCNFFNGSMDEVRVWNVARTPIQIAADMICDVPQQAGLQAYYRFDQGAAGGTNTGYTTVQDYSGNNNCGTLANFALTGTTSNFVSGAIPTCNPIASTVPDPANTGTMSICSGQTTTLSNAVTGGTWSSSNTGVATVNSTSGLVTGVSGGTANITYSLSCGTAVSVVTVNPTAIISGSSNLCMGSPAIYTPSVSGGTWSSSNTGVATVGSSSGLVTPVATGTADIMYMTAAGCTSTLSVVVNAMPSVTLGTVPSICAGTTSTTQPFTGATDVISNTVSFNYTGSMQTWTVPAFVTSITVDAMGAAGGLNSDNITVVDREGYGARVQTSLAVTPGQVLNIFVGGKGANGTTLAGGAGGYNGGGNGSFGFVPYSGGGGGGATDIRMGGTALADRVLVAAGGGGAGLMCGFETDRGGDGGTLTGENGAACPTPGAFSGSGGAPSAGGAGGAAGMPGALGTGGDGDVVSGGGTAGGGGGAGYYGGGGGSWAGGGGGSSYTDALLATDVDHNRGVNTGAGIVTITYQIPTTYSIVWDPGAITEGFANVTNSAVSSSPINITVPATAAANTYTGTLTMTNTATGCTTAASTVSLTVNPIPDVDPISSQTACNGAMTSAITFNGSVTGTAFNWMHSDPSIGIGASSSGNIATFSATNTGSVTVVSVFTVTPTRLGCVGAVETFSITVHPTPDVNPSSNQAVCNGSMTTAINFTGSVSGTSFGWSNVGPAIGLASSGTGDIAAFTATNTTTATVHDTITVTPSANGCTGFSNSFIISVYPTPVLSSSLNPPAICDNTLFSYTPTSATAGTTFDWSRAAITGITNPAATGTNDPNEVLMNSTPNPISVMYTYTLTANGCPNVQTVTIVVNPTPMLSSPLTPPAICDSTMFSYTHTSLTVGTSFAWSRAAVSGISNPAGSGTGDISEALDNITPNPITVTYIDTLTANGCMNTQTITVAVNPTPMLSTATVLSAVCDSSSILYVPSSLTTGTTYAWNRAAIGGNPAASGTDTISGPIYNNTTSPISVVHNYTLTANGCTHTQDVSIVVYPTPKLNSSLTPPALCDSSLFNYTPTSATLGSAFAWERPFLAGLNSPAGSGTGNPNEQLINNTNFNLNVVYVYTITANGCTHRQNVSVVVRPTPRLSSTLTMTTCSGVNFHYVPTGYVSGSTFTWSRALAPGIRNPAASSTAGLIDEVLVDTTLTPKVTAYRYTTTAYGCSHVQYLIVTVNPTPAALAITTAPPSTLCASTMYQNFGVASMPPVGQEYKWSATNAIVWATGERGQYALVSFPQPGEAWVMVNANVAGFNCIATNKYKVDVVTSISDEMQVVYFDGQLICLNPNQDSYQWGFDDGTTLEPTTLVGEMNPNYFISGPDFTHRHYWVKTKRGDCIQKTYYNVPLDITNVNEVAASMKLYPNPANSMLNIEISTSLNGAYELDVVNLLGQHMYKTTATGQKTTIDVASLTPGIYLVDCYQNGVKIATQKFIKN